MRRIFKATVITVFLIDILSIATRDSYSVLILSIGIGFLVTFSVLNVTIFRLDVKSIGLKDLKINSRSGTAVNVRNFEMLKFIFAGFGLVVASMGIELPD